MTKKTRKVLFLTFFFIFLSATPILAFYFQGYRFDFENKKITQTGGLFLTTIPKQTEVYLNEKFSNKTDLLFGSVLIENLLPKKYNIRIEKQGYSNWEKTLEIREKEVTEAKDIILFPKNPEFIPLSEKIKDFWFSQDGKKMVWKEKTGGLWDIKLYDLSNQSKNHLLKEKDLSKKGADLIDLSFSDDGKEIYLETIIAEEPRNFVLKINGIPSLFEEIKKSSSFEDIIISQKFNNDTYYLDNLGYLYKTDASFSTKEKITKASFPLNQETKYELYIFPGFIFLKEGNKLYLLNPETEQFENFSEQVKSLKISPNLKELAYFSEKEIRILFLKKTTTQPRRQSEEDIFLIRFSEKIEDLSWLTPQHLILNIENKIKIIEIDNRDQMNIVDLAEFDNPKIFWNLTDKKLYVLDEETIWVSKKLIP